MVTSYNMQDINQLPSPDILEMPSYEDLKAQNIALLQYVNNEYNLPIEDDDMLPIIEAFAYRELHLRAMVNLKIKNMLVHYAEGSDLDNFVWSFYGGITRLQGAYPYAYFKFTNQSTTTVTLPEGTILTNDNGERGRLSRDVTLNSTTTTMIERVEFLELIEKSDVELDRVDDFYNVTVEQVGSFVNGAAKESDESFLERSILSLNRWSTAGAVGSYYYHILESDVRIDTAYCYSPSEGVVRIVLDNFYQKIDDYGVNAIYELFQRENLKPLTDKVEVMRAEQIGLTIEVEAKLYDMMQQKEVNALIQENFSEPFKINQDLTHSELIQRLHVMGVYSVRSTNILNDVLSSPMSRIVIKGVNCVFSLR